MWFTLDLPPMQTRQKVEQVTAYFSAVENPHNPLHEAVKDTKGSRLGRLTRQVMDGSMADWESILQVCQLTELEQIKEWETDTQTDSRQHFYETLSPARKLGKAL